MQAMFRPHKALPLLALTSVFSLIGSTAAYAEQVTDQYICSAGNLQRKVELVYENRIGQVPCRIRQSIRAQAPETLWRAQFQAEFCTSQIKTFVQKLESGGYQCVHTDSATISDSGISVQTDQPAPSTATGTLASVGINNALTAIPPVPAAAPATVVTWSTAVQAATDQTEKTQADSSVTQTTTATPVARQNATDTFVPPNPVNQPAMLNELPVVPMMNDPSIDPLTLGSQLDDWIIYLNGKTLAAIKSALDNQPGAFAQYLGFEQQNAKTIYNKLQLRVEHLNAITSLRELRSTSIQGFDN